LLRSKACSFDGLADIDPDHIMLKTDGIEIQGSRCRRLDHIAGVVKDRGMTGAFKLIAFSYPGDSAAEMGALSGNGKEPAILKSTQVAVPWRGIKVMVPGRMLVNGACINNQWRRVFGILLSA